ncbi:MAG: c-type cytochrome [Myxococcota bacterium]
MKAGSVRTESVRWSTLALVAGLAVGCDASAAMSHTGPSLFENNCAPCHGTAGEGSTVAKAPAIAGLPEWYVKHQVEGFREGLRGTHFDDIQGMRMRPMARTLADDEEVALVSKHVASLPKTKAVATLTGGDAAKGATYWQTCAACHGADGKGNEALGAPPLAGGSDWYHLDQLKNFKAGVRGAHPKDTRGATMRPMASTLPDEQAMKDVLAHVGTLP